mmetsp:Transcript_60256/g.108495  ORF Transcript_60256/g.108495 Transcript_60256/m.108495 type:complete len:203 (+) Transcript_60256:852-1460(+)
MGSFGRSIVPRVGSLPHQCSLADSYHAVCAQRGGQGGSQGCFAASLCGYFGSAEGCLSIRLASGDGRVRECVHEPSHGRQVHRRNAVGSKDVAGRPLVLQYVQHTSCGGGRFGVGCGCCFAFWGLPSKGRREAHELQLPDAEHAWACLCLRTQQGQDGAGLGGENCRASRTRASDIRAAGVLQTLGQQPGDAPLRPRYSQHW